MASGFLSVPALLPSVALQCGIYPVLPGLAFACFSKPQPVTLLPALVEPRMFIP